MPANFVAKLAVTAVLTGAQMALNGLRRIEGPRLEDLNVTIADYGTPLNYFYGTRRFQAVPIFWAEPLREVKKKRKTKGGKYNEYKYFATFAVAVADHEIDAITRIWWDKHLIYDVTGTGPISPLADGTNINAVQRLFLGSETQEPDPRMQATIEAEHGVGTCPAFRGVAGALWEEAPVQLVGNRIPQVSVEAVDNSTAAFPFETVTSGQDNSSTFTFGPSGAFMAYWDHTGGRIQWWDAASRTALGTSSSPGFASNGEAELSLASDGTAYQAGAVLDGLDVDLYLAVTPPMGTPVMTLTDDATAFVDVTRCLESETERRIYTAYSDTAGYMSETSHVDHDLRARDFCVDAEGRFWGIFQPNGSSDEFTLENLDNNEVYSFTGTTRSDVSAARICHVAHAGHFFVHTDGNFYLIDDTTFTVNDSGAAGWGSGPNLPYNNPDATSFWDDFAEYSLIDGSLIRSLSKADWTNISDSHHAYDPTNHAIWSRKSASNDITIRYLDRISGGGVTLGAIVADVCSRCDIASADRETSDLDQTVLGYSWTQGSGKAIIEPLLDFYDSDARPHDFKLQFLKRDNSSEGVIGVTEFLGESPRYKIIRAQDTDLPRGITLSFADSEAEQQPNSVVARRDLDAVDAVREASFDLTTLVLSPDEAREGAERYFRRIWNSKESYEHGLTVSRLALEPADIWTLALDDISRAARLQKLTFRIAADNLGCEWQQDSTLLTSVVSFPGAPQEGREESVIFVPVLSAGFILDIPLIQDSHNGSNPLLYYGAGPYSDGLWPGADINQSADGTDYDTDFAEVGSESPLTFGQASTTLASATHYVWDRGNTVTVTLSNGTLTSATEAACDANPRLNLALLGNELIQFATATLTGTRTYQLSGLKRGLRGTEWAVGTHTSSDRLVLMDDIAFEEMGAGDIGDTLYFQTITIGREIGVTTSFAYTGASHRPWAPDQFKAKKDASTGDWTFIWKRRSRVAGDWMPGTPPLGESSEDYELNIYNGSVIVRTIPATSETATWTSAQQTTDFGSGQSTVKAGVLQVGDLADGFETVTTFTGSTYG